MLLRLSITLAATVLLLGCTSQLPQIKPSSTPSANIPTPDTATLKAAIKELQMLQIKVKDGINYKGYAELIDNTVPVIQSVKGEAKVVAAAKSAFAGHQLALKFWECDRLDGYTELHQCQSNALSGIFTKYPDIAAQAKAVIKSQDLSTISTELDKEDFLKKIWEKTKADTETARRGISAVRQINL